MSAYPGLTDIHAHPAMNAFLWGRDLRHHWWSGDVFNPLATLSDFKMLRKGGVKVLWNALHVPEPAYLECRYLRLVARLFSGGRMMLKEDEWTCLVAMRDKMERQTARAKGFRVAHSNAELDLALDDGDTAIVNTLEGTHHLGAGLADDDLQGRLDRLEELSRWGVASITLAHLFPNDVAGHAEGIPEEHRKGIVGRLCPLDTKVDPDRGLTDTGRAVIERMIDLRMIPDITHCTPNARREVFALVDNRIPIIASHIGVSSMNPVPYNLGPDDVRAIKASNGVIGVIFMPYWLEHTHPGPGLDPIWRTMAQLHEWSDGTWDHVAIGTDFDGFTDPPDDCNDASQLPVVRERLEREGLDRSDVEKVLGTNARRVLRDGWI